MTTDPTPTLSLVVPTLNEAAGIEAFLRQLLTEIDGLPVEVLVLDDRSQDGTAELAQQLFDELDTTHRVVVRTDTPGLGASVVEGWRLGQGAVLGVMDADLSHPPTVIPALLDAINGGADVAVATRYMPGGGTEGWPKRRQLASRVASAMARTLVRARDPLSGCLLLRRTVIDLDDLDPTGWKIGLEVLVKGNYRRLAEVPYTFRDRAAGESKFGGNAVKDYLAHLARLRAWLLRRGTLRK